MIRVVILVPKRHKCVWHRLQRAWIGLWCGIDHARQTAVISMALPVTGRLVWPCADHTVKLESAVRDYQNTRFSVAIGASAPLPPRPDRLLQGVGGGAAHHPVQAVE